VISTEAHRLAKSQSGTTVRIPNKAESNLPQDSGINPSEAPSATKAGYTGKITKRGISNKRHWKYVRHKTPSVISVVNQ
jgi:hypothetical protein